MDSLSQTITIRLGLELAVPFREGSGRPGRWELWELQRQKWEGTGADEPGAGRGLCSLGDEELGGTWTVLFSPRPGMCLGSVGTEAAGELHIRRELCWVLPGPSACCGRTSSLSLGFPQPHPDIIRITVQPFLTSFLFSSYALWGL